MKKMLLDTKIISVGLAVVGITSYAVLAQNTLESKVDVSKSVVKVEMPVEETLLEDISISKDVNMPSDVGVDVSREGVKGQEFPSIPGFEKKADGIIGRVPNENRTMIQLIDVGDKYELRTSSEILYDKMVQSYVKQVMDYYKDKKYTYEISGIYAILRIDK